MKISFGKKNFFFNSEDSNCYIYDLRSETYF